MSNQISTRNLAQAAALLSSGCHLGFPPATQSEGVYHFIVEGDNVEKLAADDTLQVPYKLHERNRAFLLDLIKGRRA